MSSFLSPYGGGGSGARDPSYFDFPFGFPNRFCVDWLETPTEHVITADIPGLNKEDIKVQVEDGKVLEISYERIRKKGEETDKWYNTECVSGKCIRKFALPENAVADQVNARLENGVLTVIMGKKDDKNGKIKPVEISG